MPAYGCSHVLGYSTASAAFAVLVRPGGLGPQCTDMPLQPGATCNHHPVLILKNSLEKILAEFLTLCPRGRPYIGGRAAPTAS